MATAKDGCDPGGHCWTAPCRHLSQGHSFPITGTQSSDWACPRLQFPSRHSLAMDLLTWAQTPTFRVTSWPSLSIAPMAPPGHPKTGSDPGYCLLTRAQICCSLVITISGFSKAQGDHMQLILNKRRKKKNTDSFWLNTLHPISISIYFHLKYIDFLQNLVQKYTIT